MWKLPYGWFKIEYRKLPSSVLVSGGLSALVESARRELAYQWSNWDTLVEVWTEQIELDGVAWATSRYKAQESADYCYVEVEERLALVVYNQIRHGVVLQLISCVGHEPDARVLDAITSSFDWAESEPYYQQFRDARGVAIKAPDGVRQNVMDSVVQLVEVMLDGAKETRDCIPRWNSAVVIRKRGHVNTDLPEYAYLKGQRDIWGRSYDTEKIWGLGAVPYNRTSMISESSLLGEYHVPPYWVGAHEFAHHLMNLCFTEEQRRQLSDLYDATIEANLGYEEGIMVNHDEFFAEFSTIYFDTHHTHTRRSLARKLPDMYDFLEAFYGKLTVRSSKRNGYVQYVTPSGLATPWEVRRSVAFVE